jgi:hypothetical protein
MDIPFRLTAILLILGGTVFLIGAAFWLMEFQQQLQKTLPVIIQRRKRWMWIHGWMLPGVVLTAVALFVLRDRMMASGETMWSTLMAVLFLIGVVPVICMLTFRITVMDQAATYFVRTGQMPASFEYLHQWSVALYAVHTVLSYLASFFLGLAAFSGGVFPTCFAWTAVIFGASGTLGFVLMRGGPFAPPILVHVIPLMAGIVLIFV